MNPADNSATPNTEAVVPIASKKRKTFSLSAARNVATRQDRGTLVKMRDEEGEPLMTEDDAGNEVPAEARVAGEFSNLYAAAEGEVNDKMLKRRVTELDNNTVNLQELTKVAKCVISWNLRDGKRPIACDVANVTEVLVAAPWIKADFIKAMKDPARFLD